MFRSPRWQLYGYIIHVVLDNAVYQGHRKSFMVGDTDPKGFGISKLTATRILRDLKTAAVLSQPEKHPRKYQLSSMFRDRVTKLPIEQKHVVAQRLLNAIEKDIVFRFHADSSNVEKVYDALGVSEWEQKQVLKVTP